MKTTEEMIAVMQAAVDGKRIQSIWLHGKGQVWHDVSERFGQNGPACWDWTNRDYRIKPEPKMLYVVEDRNGYPVGAHIYRSLHFAKQAALAQRNGCSVSTYQQILD